LLSTQLNAQSRTGNNLEGNVTEISSEIVEEQPSEKEIIIDKSDRKLYIYENGKVVAEFLVGIGKDGYETPTGEFRILAKAKNPAWRPPQRAWSARARKHVNSNGVIPYGSPWNPLKYYFFALGGGIGIHGYANDEGLGKKSSHGCLRAGRVCLEYVARDIPIGTKVKIQE